MTGPREREHLSRNLDVTVLLQLCPNSYLYL